MRPICARCEMEMVWITGIYVFEMAKSAFGGKTCGVYKVWNSDGAKCGACGAIVVVRFADRPITEQHKEDAEAQIGKILKLAREGKCNLVYNHEVIGGEKATLSTIHQYGTFGKPGVIRRKE